jgi:hypothetical protein
LDAELGSKVRRFGFNEKSKRLVELKLNWRRDELEDGEYFRRVRGWVTAA